ncbi:hypothetical protein ruthe_02603 [Rubellimicrobium thermophilum DSM 16684]|uniref:Uncharacterized protein n=1 Tax=Rubellimicrobium thermophilum DSM 16684 TaxID=1123069 RepID=S9S0P4_9RHOB|nr:hypothetical protein ruthe_02603 [Rubellimicrobium thermophilum DSM 16684]
MTTHSTTAMAVVIQAFLFRWVTWGAPSCVPGTTSPASPCVTIRIGSTTKKVMNQMTAKRTRADVIVMTGVSGTGQKRL